MQDLLADIFEVEPQEITEKTVLTTDLFADEMDFEEIRFALEEEFDIVLTKSEMMQHWKTATAGDLQQMIHRKRCENSGLHVVEEG